MRVTHEPLGRTLHRITHQAVVSELETVTARSYVDVIVLGEGNQRGAQAAGFEVFRELAHQRIVMKPAVRIFRARGDPPCARHDAVV
jgi:hypothetical protein